MSELAEGARLEIVCAAKSGTEGSNPSLSAILHRFFPLVTAIDVRTNIDAMRCNPKHGAGSAPRS